MHPDQHTPIRDGAGRGWSHPLPRTGHPLGIIAQVWIALNCFAGGGLIGGLVGMYGTEAASLWITGRRPPQDLEVILTTSCIVFGSIAGLFIASRLIHRLSDRGVHLVVLTLTVIPVIGVYFAIALGLAALWIRLRPLRPERRG